MTQTRLPLLRTAAVAAILLMALVPVGCGGGGGGAGSSEVVPEAQLDLPPNPITLSPPGYPKSLDGTGAQGTVFVNTRINAEGKVIHTQVTSPIEGYPAFNDSAKAALERSTFQPAQVRGKPVTAEMVIPVVFVTPDSLAKLQQQQADQQEAGKQQAQPEGDSQDH